MSHSYLNAKKRRPSSSATKNSSLDMKDCRHIFRFRYCRWVALDIGVYLVTSCNAQTDDEKARANRSELQRDQAQQLYEGERKRCAKLATELESINGTLEDELRSATHHRHYTTTDQLRAHSTIDTDAREHYRAQGTMLSVCVQSTPRCRIQSLDSKPRSCNCGVQVMLVVLSSSRLRCCSR